jgi:hypothetical protein
MPLVAQGRSNKPAGWSQNHHEIPYPHTSSQPLTTEVSLTLARESNLDPPLAIVYMPGFLAVQPPTPAAQGRVGYPWASEGRRRAAKWRPERRAAICLAARAPARPLARDKEPPARQRRGNRMRRCSRPLVFHPLPVAACKRSVHGEFQIARPSWETRWPVAYCVEFLPGPYNRAFLKTTRATVSKEYAFGI